MKNNLIFLYSFAGFTENLEAGVGGASGGWWEFTNLSSKMMNTKDTLLVQFSCSVMSDSVTPWMASCQASLSITNPQNLLKLMSIELVMPSNHLILCRPLLLNLQSFPASRSFQMSQFFASGCQSIGVSASASVLPMNIQD